MARPRPFGVSTQLFLAQTLSRDHLVDVGAAGFELIDLHATRTHFDYENLARLGDLQGWLADARLGLHAVHAPVAEGFAAGQWTGRLSLASPDPALRLRALAEAERALHVARRLPFAHFIVHLGLPRTPQSPAGENSRDAARRSVEALHALASPLGVTLALEVTLNDLSRPAALVHFIDAVREAAPVGLCLDFGHAHLDGDLVEAIETVSEHLIAAEVHDNRGRADEHRLPFDGTIDWAAALTAVQKVGYDGPLVFEVNAQGAARTTLQKLRDVRRRMERLLGS